jgi:hypothetical protein
VVVARYLEEEPVAYLIAPAEVASRFEASPRLARVAGEWGHVLFAVKDAAARARPWVAPAALVQRQCNSDSQLRFLGDGATACPWSQIAYCDTSNVERAERQ